MANSVITDYRRVQLCQVTSGGAAGIAPIAQIAFGDGGVDAGGNPVAPLGSASALVSELARYPVDAVTYPIATTARYTATVPAGDLAGASVSEAALVDSGGNLCAIQTMFSKRKDDGVTFTFTFDDEF